MKTNYSIIMADIIKSRNENPNQLMTKFKSLVNTINKEQKKLILTPLTITLGDEFQGIASSMENGVNLIFAIEEMIIKKGLNIKLRYVLNYGKIETKINTLIAHEMLGEGLTYSRKKLESSKKEDQRFKIINNSKENPDEYINEAFSLYQDIVDNWKAKDLETVSKFLVFDDYKIVAEKINTNASSAWRRKKSLKINEYASIKKIILHLLENQL